MEFANKSKEYKRTDHMVYSCQYHVIFCPKYRRKILKDGLDEIVKKSFLDTAKMRKFDIVEMEVMPDHVHLLIDCNPRYGIMNVVKQLKWNSVEPMKEFMPSLESRLPNIWTRSAFISTVGSVSLETVRSYIESQKGM